MRKSTLLALGLAVFSWAGAAEARQSFVSEGLERNIGEDLGDLASRPLPQLRNDVGRALARKDFKTALKLSAAIVAANPKDSGAWMAYSRVAIAADDDEELQAAGAAAALIAYQRATDKPSQAAALAWLGEIFAKRSMWRAALDA